MMGDQKDKDPLGVVAKLVQAAIAKKHRKSSAVVGACNQLLARVMAVDLPDDPFLNADVRVIQPNTKPTEYDRFWLSVGTLCCASFTDALAAFADQRCCPRDIQPLETRYVLSTLMWRANSHLCSAAQITRAFFGNLKGLFVTCDGKRFSPTVSCMVPKQQQQQQQQLEEQEPHHLQAVSSNSGTKTPRQKRAARWRHTKQSKLNNKNTTGNKNTQCFSKLPVVVRVTEDSVNLPRNNLFLTHGQLLVCTWTQTTTASQNNQCSANQEKEEEEEEEVNDVRGVCLVKQNVGGACAQSIVFGCTTTATTTATSRKSHNSSNSHNNSNQATSDTEQENKDDTDDVCVRTTSDFKHAVVNHRQACGTDAYAVVFAPGNSQDNGKGNSQDNGKGNSQDNGKGNSQDNGKGSSQGISSLGTETSIVDMSRSVVLCFRFASIEACGEASGVLVRNTFGPHLFIALCDLDAGIVSKASTHSRVCGEFCSSVVSDYASSTCGAQVHLPHDVSFVVSQRNFAIAAWPQKLGLIERHMVANAVRWQLVSVFALRPHDSSDILQPAANSSSSSGSIINLNQSKKQWLEGWPCPRTGLVYVSSDTHTYAIKHEGRTFKFVSCGLRTPKPEAILFM
jgi:hypothetical protein